MRIRIKFLTFFASFLIFTPLFWILLAKFLRENDSDYDEDYDLKPVIPEKSREQKIDNKNIISKSVLLGYSNADKLAIFSAHRWKDKITVVLQSYGYLNRQVYCRFFDVSKSEHLQSAHPATVFPEFTVHCSPKSANFSSHVAITVNKKDIPENMHVVLNSEFQDSENSSRNSEFTVCLAPLFGESPKNLMLIEFIEYYRLQGADNFLIYSYNISEKTSKLLTFYKNRKINKIGVEVIKIGNSTKCGNRHRCRHEMQLQDCIFRTQSYAKWVALVDLDERIMPINQHLKISELLEKYSEKSIAELRFRCQWTLRYAEIPRGNLSIQNLPMMTWHNTSHVAPTNHTSKSIVRPRLVDGMGVHGVLKQKNGAKLVLVTPEKAVVRHYRLVTGWSYFLKEAEGFGEFWKLELGGELQNSMVTAVGTIIDEFSGFS